ncbi:hypothetical protein SAMN04488128_103706 [Chitinophaga eiseniae]|uniref:YD repeat-containing protein n=1 Tax=Chitinophaga eiseniae TaxID=634771 RepID=A0A1T4SX34_9BACT|nr:hypothetical protein [Chitinophaga eiseniae]SKA32719.1 hypothetical protein SAMN04488128_103706 [Chitinophaga eiseniae]
MRNLRSLIILLMTLHCCALNSHAQDKLGGAGADSKMLPGGSDGGGGGGLYTPNLYDGSATVNIPIYQYSAEDGSFGVGFSFNTRGIKVDAIASSAGQGWEFSLPNITRVVKDLPDEVNFGADTFLYAPVYDYNPGGEQYKLNNFYWMKGRYAVYSESGSTADPNIYRDGEADDYVVNLGSGSFTFNLGKNNYIFTNPARSVKVELLLNGAVITSVNDFQVIGIDEQQKLEFRITDEGGTQYRFIRGDFEMRTIEDEHGQGMELVSYWLTTKWVIKEVTLPGGAKITYNYDHIIRPGGSVVGYRSYSLKEGGGSIGSLSMSDERTYNPRFAIPTAIQYPNAVELLFNYDSQKRPDFPYGALRSLKTHTTYNCIEYKLHQSFWYDSTGQPVAIPYAQGLVTYDGKARLRLDSVSIASCDGTVTESYFRFEYSPLRFPRRLSVSQDYFGYYNGAVYSGSDPNTIPYHQRWWPGNPNPGYYGIYRTYNPAGIEAGILRKITNAYGGTTSFYYGGHVLSTVLPGLPTDDNFMGDGENDGIRLDSVVEKEQYHIENSRVTRFIYSGGQRFLDGGYFYSPLAWKTVGGVLTMFSMNYTGNYVTPHHLVGGSNHGYSNVTVESRMGNGTLLSKKAYVFTNLYDAYSGIQTRYTIVGGGKHFYQYPFTDKSYLRDWEMGLPLSVTEYDNNNRIVKQTLNTYDFRVDSMSAVGKVENRKAGKMSLYDTPLPGAPTQMSTRDSLDYYRPYRGWALPLRTVTRKYFSDAQYVADTTLFAYDARNNLSEIITTNSKGQKMRTVTVYNYSVATQSASQTIYQMNQAGLEKKLGMERWIMGTTRAEDQLLDASISTFSYQNGILLPKALYAFESATLPDYNTYTGAGNVPVPPLYQRFHTAFLGNAVTYFQKVSEVQASDSKGNPLETLLPLSGQYKSMIWDTLTGQKLAEASCRLADMGYTGFDVSHKGSFSYNSGGITWVADAPAGRNAYSFGSGAVTRSGFTPNKPYRIGFWSNGTPTCTIGSTPVSLVAAPAQGNWTYYEAGFTPATGSDVLSISGPSLKYIDELRLYPANAAIQCYSYEQMFGKRADIDHSGRMTYYEYDKLGRRTIIRNQEGAILSKTEFYIGQ